MAYIKVPKTGRRTEWHNKPKPFLCSRPGHGMPGCHEPNLAWEGNKDNFDKGFEKAFDKKQIKKYQKGRRFKIYYKDGKLVEEIK